MQVIHSRTTVRRLQAGVLAGFLMIVIGGATAAAVAAALMQDDDPFADELNPFGTGVPRPSATVTPPAARPDNQAEARPLAAPPAEPPTPRPRPKLPVPFPESTEPTDRPAGRPSLRGPVRAPAVRVPVRAPDGPPRDGMFGGFDEPGEEAERKPSAAEKKLVEAERLEQQGKLPEARELLREVVTLEPTLTIGHLALGVVLRRLGDFRGAVDACSKGIEIDPLEPELYLRRGISWYHLGLNGIALEDFEEAAGLAYDDPRPELWRGLTLIELDRPLEAINAYASAIRRDRTCMLAYLNRGLAYLSTDEPRKAEFDFNQAIRQKPKDVRAWTNRGVAQARQGRYREAIESYETALGISPGDKPSRVNLEAARRLAAGEASRGR
jgi:tetratricopeptide (TPR) repeat protein